MDSNENFDLKYLGNDYYNYQNFKEKKERHLARKVFVVLFFLNILIVTPLVLYQLKSSLKTNKKTEISTAASISPISNPVANNTSKKEEPNKTQSGDVIKGDSYWKISKRYCGSGKYYLTIRDLNDGKPLFLGGSVKISCTL